MAAALHPTLPCGLTHGLPRSEGAGLPRTLSKGSAYRRGALGSRCRTVRRSDAASPKTSASTASTAATARCASSTPAWVRRRCLARLPVAWVDVALHEPLDLQGPQDLRGHLDVGAGLAGQRLLVRRLASLAQPPGAGQQDELHVCEVEVISAVPSSPGCDHDGVAEPRVSGRRAAGWSAPRIPWHDTMINMGLRAMAAPTRRGPSSVSTSAVAVAPWVLVRPEPR